MTEFKVAGAHEVVQVSQTTHFSSEQADAFQCLGKTELTVTEPTRVCILLFSQNHFQGHGTSKITCKLCNIWHQH